ncbi:MAG TPA: ABC transporter substrate-binding protein [Longimicrobiales bacterium]
MALLLPVALLGACRRDDAEQEAAGPPQRGGTVVAGVRADFGGFNPVTNTDVRTDEIIKFALFTPLIQYDRNLEVQPYLAESWELLGDTAVVFRLRSDVRWHDGQPVTAEDVKFTFDLAKDPAAASLIGTAYLANVDRAEVLDPHTIRFHFARPHAQALEDFWWAPLPRHLLQGVAPADLRNAPFNRRPVGSGPYRFVEWRANDRLVLERNPDFPAALGGPPHLDRVVIRVVPEVSTLLTELVTGGVQVNIDVQPEQVSQIQASRGLELFSYPGRTVFYIGWNNQRRPFDDPRVRRAMTLAIDRQAIINALLAGQGVPATSTIPPWHPLYPEDVQPLPYDVAQADELLDAAGWIDRNHDGVREDSQGRPFRFTLLTSDRTLNRAVAEIVQDQLRRVGVQADVRVLEFQTLLAQHRSRDFDAVFTNWVLDNFQVASAPAALFLSRLADVPLSSNRSGVRSPRLDALIERGAATVDPGQARAVWREFTLALQEEQPFTFMFWLNELAAASTRVQGIEMDPRGEFLTIRSWWVPGGRTAAR